MPFSRKPSPGDSKAQLERHVKARSRRPIPIQFDSGEIVNRESASLNEFEDTIQSSRAAWNFQCRPRHESERADSGYISETQILKLVVVGNVQENVSARLSDAWHALASSQLSVLQSLLLSYAAATSHYSLIPRESNWRALSAPRHGGAVRPAPWLFPTALQSEM